MIDKSKETVDMEYWARIDNQMKNLEAIYNKILQLETENPSLEIIGALYVELGQVSQEISGLVSRQEETDHHLEEVQHLLREKENRLKELEHYQEEKDHLIKLLKFRDYENEQLRREKDKLTLWMRKLQKYYKKVLDSNSWKIGSAIVRLANKLRLKGNKNKILRQMNKIFKEFECMDQESQKLIKDEDSSGDINSSLIQLTKWLDQLRSNMKMLFDSRRGRFTRFLGQFILGPIGKGKTPKQIKNIDKVFAEYEALSEGEGMEKAKRLKALIEDFEDNYRSFVSSKRWKASDKLFTFLNTILLRKQQKLVTVKIEKILRRFNEWKKRQNQI